MTELIVTEIGMILAFIVGYIFGKNSKSSTTYGKLKMTKHDKEMKKKQDEKFEKDNDDLQTTLDNINNYDGTGAGQKKYN